MQFCVGFPHESEFFSLGKFCVNNLESVAGADDASASAVGFFYGCINLFLHEGFGLRCLSIATQPTLFCYYTLPVALQSDVLTFLCSAWRCAAV